MLADLPDASLSYQPAAWESPFPGKWTRHMNGVSRNRTGTGNRRHPKQANPVQLVGKPEGIA